MAYKEIIVNGHPVLVDALTSYNDKVNAVLDGESGEKRDALLDCINKGMVIIPRNSPIYDPDTLKQVGILL